MKFGCRVGLNVGGLLCKGGSSRVLITVLPLFSDLLQRIHHLYLENSLNIPRNMLTWQDGSDEASQTTKAHVEMYVSR